MENPNEPEHQSYEEAERGLAAKQQLVVTQPGMNYASRWSQWALASSRLYYYRGRYITYEAALAFEANSRNSIVSDELGHYIHYEFLGINEASRSHCILLPASQPSASSSAEHTVSTPETDNDGSSGSSNLGCLAISTQTKDMDISSAPDGLNIGFAAGYEKLSLGLNKKARKRFRAERNMRFNSKAKVNTWLRSE
ncbi:hypothetical protein G7046_g1804 [Stylonectria norvegica]|nr:hypothetical protein G7046_g1804 [Stylonectria norvegica]